MEPPSRTPKIPRYSSLTLADDIYEDHDLSEPPSWQRQPVYAQDEVYKEISAADRGTDHSRWPGAHGLGLRNLVGRPARIKRMPVRRPGLTASTEALRMSAQPIDGHDRVMSTDNLAFQPEITKLGGTNSPRHRAHNSNSTPTTPYTPYFSSDDGFLDSPRKVDVACPTHGDILISPWNWLSITLLVLAVYATVWSGIFLGIALAKPRWGHRVGTRGALSFANASLLSALIAKTVELSFVTVFVAVLGQILSRRAFAKTADRKGGISIAEMTMRSWVTQPGILLTHWSDFRYAITTILGIVVMGAVFAATFYTTAAEALVAPKLKYGPLEERMLSGSVVASYGNSIYLAANCAGPITDSEDEYRGTTCLQIEHAGSSFHNLRSFLTSWNETLAAGNTSLGGTAFAGRPLPPAIMYDNTTVTGQWVTPSSEHITIDSERYGRMILNVTMAMPHANVFNAVRNPLNMILQPDDLNGMGEYNVQAALPAPSINVLCAGLSTDELQPMIANVTDYLNYTALPTVLDSIFEWNNISTPYFPKAPIVYNTIAHIPVPWGPTSVYLLATPPPDTATNDHTLCQIRSTLYPNCTTHYAVAQSGGQLSVHCDSDPLNTMPYASHMPDAPFGVYDPDWKDIAGEWIRSLALNNGVSDANASSARLMSQFIPEFSPDAETLLPATRPSIAEALAVLAGSTVLLTSASAPFIHVWNYTGGSILATPATETFPARYAYKDYASGGTQAWQGMFYVILFVVFFFSLFSAGYLVWKSRQGYVTDYTEPQNLFALAVNSPPSGTLAGSCGGGPHGSVMGVKWCVDMDNHGYGTRGGYQASGERHPHFFMRPKDDDGTPMVGMTPRFGTGGVGGVPSPGLDQGLGSPESRMARFRRSRPPTVAEWGGDSALEQYNRLSKTRT